MQFQSLIEKYIRTYDNVINDKLCGDMIADFEKNKEQFDVQTLEGHRSFTQIALQQHENWKQFLDPLYWAFNKCIKGEFSIQIVGFRIMSLSVLFC